MPTFIPPTKQSLRRTGSFASSSRYPLARYYASGSRGENIYRLVDGSFVESEPRDASLIDRVFFGGHQNYVTDIEADALVAAGYTVVAGTFEIGSSYSSTLGSDATLGV